MDPTHGRRNRRARGRRCDLRGRRALHGAGILERGSRANYPLTGGETSAARSLRDVTVRSDSVIGFAADGRERRAIPSAEVASIEHREVSVLRTGAAMGATAAVGYVAFICIAFARLGPNWTAVPSPAPSAP